MPRSDPAPGGRRAALAAAGVALALLVTGCGDEERTATPVGGDGATTSTQEAPAATTTTPATTTAPDATGTATTPAGGATTTPGGTGGVAPGEDTGGVEAPEGEAQAGGAGDEEPTRVPATFRLAAGEDRTQRVTVPEAIPVELRLRGGFPQAQRITLGRTDVLDVTVPAGATGLTTVLLPGLQPGEYPLLVEGEPNGAVLVVGGEAGP